MRFADETLSGLSPYSICQRGISRTFQITALFPEMTARENARLAAQARHVTALAALWWRHRVRRRGDAAAMRRWNGWG